jgi:hypothetical protein
MATLASTFVSAFAEGQPVPIGPLHMEVWRLQVGTIGDTNTVTPKRGRFIPSAVSGFPGATSLSTLGTDTQVVFTQGSSVASTSVTYDAVLYVQE